MPDQSVELLSKEAAEQLALMNKELIHGNWIIFLLNGRHFGIAARCIREMFHITEMRSIPNHPSIFRGLTSLRNEVFNVLDLRKFLGFKSMPEEYKELADNLKQRRKDHENWVHELEISIKENKPFKLATDPHKCAFGKWYDAFQTPVLKLARTLDKFDNPHRKIHGVALKTLDALKEKGQDVALKLIDETRNKELSSLLKLFDEVDLILEKPQREIGMVFEFNDVSIVLTVDDVLMSKKFDDSTAKELNDTNVTNTFSHAASIPGIKEEVLLIRPETIATCGKKF